MQSLFYLVNDPATLISGLVGQELRKRGFCNIDAHDGADAMMEYCKKTGFYKNFYVSVVGDGHRLPIKDRKLGINLSRI